MIIDPRVESAAATYRWLTACIVPRPIALVSTVSIAGTFNLAPFSFFNAICGAPPLICFAPSQRNPPKDTLTNVTATGEFVVNVVDEDIAEQMNISSAEYLDSVDEFVVTGLTPLPSLEVRAPRVGESRINLECRVRQIVELSALPFGATMIIGEVVLFHIDDSVISRSRVDLDVMRVIARMGGNEYVRTRDRFSMKRPTASAISPPGSSLT